LEGNEGGVRGLGKIGDGLEAGDACEPVAVRIDGVDGAGKAELLRHSDGDLGLQAADEHDRARRDQAGKRRAVHQPPSGRKRAREMMWRWISLVPSQMRSTLASRQMRSS